jgi:Tfp pilus assembly protein PilF
MDRLEKLKAFLEENPRDNFIRHAMALEYIKLGNDQEARTLFENILSDDPAYTGSYYHLAKLLERNEETDEAVKVYEKGMEMAKKAGDDLSYRELKGAWEELTF